MNILFLTLSDFNTIYGTGIYQDLIREFKKHNHNVFVISPVEKRKAKRTYLIKDKNITILKLKIGNTQKTNVIEKGISTVFIETIFIAGIKKYFSDTKFELLLYSTPPITFCNVIKYIKKRDNAKSYLLLKDIFPQNAVDIGMMCKTGIKSFLYKFFRAKEKELYKVSDYIGCMSPANANYIIKHNPEINPQIIEVCPNSIEAIDKTVDEKTRKYIREKYGIPLDKKIFVYGGNLGKPQGIDFLIKCIYSQKMNKEAFFLVIGDGTEYRKLKYFVEKYPQENFKLMQRLPKQDYDEMIGACDVGLIFLDHRFTIPNFPSRLLGYMQAKIPVIVCTDPNTDIGAICVNNGFGWWCESNDIETFNECIRNAVKADVVAMGKKEYKYLIDNYTVEKSYNIIMKHWISH